MAKGTTDKRRLIKFSNYSMCITLPKWVIDQLEWQKGDLLTLSTDVKQGKITLYKEKAAESKKEVTTPKQPPQTPSNESPESEFIPATELPEGDDQDTPKLRW